MDGFEPPGAANTGSAEVDLDARPGVLVNLGALVLALASAFLVGSGVQLWAFFQMSGWVKAIATLMILWGSGALVCAGFLARGRSWAAILALALSGVQALLAAGWCIYAVMGGLLSPMMILAALGSLLAVPMVALAIPGAIRATAARRALYE